MSSRVNVSGYEIVKTYHGNIKLSRTGDQKGMSIIINSISMEGRRIDLNLAGEPMTGRILNTKQSPILKVSYEPETPDNPDDGQVIWTTIPMSVREKLIKFAKEHDKMR